MSPAGRRGRLSVLIFHRVVARPDPLFPDEMDAARFDAVCGWLRHWFHVIPLDDAVRRLQADTLPARALAITFDDGYADNHDVALPILLRHGMPATFFVATGFLDGGRMWNDTVIEAIRGTNKRTLDLNELRGLSLGCFDLSDPKRRRVAIDSVLSRLKHLEPTLRLHLAESIAHRAEASLPNDLMMTSGQVRAMHRAGMGIGAHTVTHPILAVLDAASAHAEIAGSKLELESLLDSSVRLFAYPNGQPDKDYTAESVSIAKAVGFDAAVTTAWGACDRTTDLFEIPRFTPWDQGRARFALRLMRNLNVEHRRASRDAYARGQVNQRGCG